MARSLNQILEEDFTGYTEDELKEQLDISINECREDQGEITVCGITFDASEILKELDPIAYRCAFADFSSEYHEAEDGTYYREEDFEAAQEIELEELEAEEEDEEDDTEEEEENEVSK